MAKKKRTEAVNPAEEQGRLAAARAAIAGAAEKAAEVVTKAVEAVKEQVVAPVVKTVKPKKPKKVRYVREKAEPRTAPGATPLPKPSTKSKAKLMSRNVLPPHKGEPKLGSGQKPKT